MNVDVTPASCIYNHYFTRKKLDLFLSFLRMLPLNRLQFTFCLDPGFDCKVANALLFTGKISPFFSASRFGFSETADCVLKRQQHWVVPGDQSLPVYSSSPVLVCSGAVRPLLLPHLMAGQISATTVHVTYNDVYNLSKLLSLIV